MNPLISEVVADFESEEQAASYDRWLIAKVQASIDDPRPSIPNEQVIAEMSVGLARYIDTRTCVFSSSSVVVVDARTSIDTSEQAKLLNSGAVECLFKPFSEAQLLKALSAALPLD